MPGLATALIVRVIFPLLVTGPLTQTPGGAPAQPQAQWRLADAPIKRLVKERILAELNKEYYKPSKPDADERAPALTSAGVKFVRLNPSGRMGIQVRAPNEWCGATGNCGVWIFDAKTGDLLVNDDGWDYEFRPTMHHGVFDFYVRHNWSAASGRRNEYQFDGKVFQQVDSIDEQ